MSDTESIDFGPNLGLKYVNLAASFHNHCVHKSTEANDHVERSVEWMRSIESLLKKAQDLRDKTSKKTALPEEFLSEIRTFQEMHWPNIASFFRWDPEGDDARQKNPFPEDLYLGTNIEVSKDDLDAMIQRLTNLASSEKHGTAHWARVLEKATHDQTLVTTMGALTVHTATDSCRATIRNFLTTH